MEKIPTIRLVFDRKHIATKKVKGLVQIEIMYERKRKWVSADVKLYKDQWDERRHVVNSASSIETNEWLDKQIRDIKAWIMNNMPFSWERFSDFLKAREPNDNFIDFLERDINERNDISEGTRKAHRKLVTALSSFGRIKYMSDLKQCNVMLFDNFLHGRRIRKLDKEGNETFVPMRQQSIYSYHRLMRTYIHRAMRLGLIKDDPYSGQRFERGESEPDRYLSETELHKLMSAEMRSGCIARSRDVFVFECYTGLAYADLRLFDFSKAENEGGDYVYSGKRKKTGEPFYFVILKPAMDILKKYNFKLPVVSAQGYNNNLKKAAKDAGIDKPLASHWARRTAGMMLLNAGVRLETVAKILGHASVATTEKFYTEITKHTVMGEMKKLEL